MVHDYICLLNSGYEKSLTVGEIYIALPDEILTKTDLIRIVDNSGESYLFPRKLFAVVT